MMGHPIFDPSFGQALLELSQISPLGSCVELRWPGTSTAKAKEQLSTCQGEIWEVHRSSREVPWAEKCLEVSPTIIASSFVCFEACNRVVYISKLPSYLLGWQGTKCSSHASCFFAHQPRLGEKEKNGDAQQGSTLVKSVSTIGRRFAIVASQKRKQKSACVELCIWYANSCSISLCIHCNFVWCNVSICFAWIIMPFHKRSTSGAFMSYTVKVRWPATHSESRLAGVATPANHQEHMILLSCGTRNKDRLISGQKSDRMNSKIHRNAFFLRLNGGRSQTRPAFP